MGYRTMVLALMVLVHLCLYAQTQSRPKPGSDASAEDEIVQIEKQWLAAANHGDTATLDVLMSEEFFATTPGGNIVGKNALIPSDNMASTLPKLSVNEPKVHVSGDIAVLMARLVTDDRTQEMDTTAVFQKQNGKWRIIAAQLSRHKSL